MLEVNMFMLCASRGYAQRGDRRSVYMQRAVQARYACSPDVERSVATVPQAFSFKD